MSLTGLRDIGKADPLFQKKDATLAARLPAEYTADCQMEHVRGFRHEMRSGDFIGKLLANSATDYSGIFMTAARPTRVGVNRRPSTRRPLSADDSEWQYASDLPSLSRTRGCTC